MVRKVILEDSSGEELIPYTNLATSQSAGRVRPDGSTISVDANGVISTINMQTTITGAATTVVSDNLTKNRVIVTNASGKLAASGITATELSYLDNATSNIQTQINNCVHLSGDETIAGTKTFTNSMITDNILPKGDITLGTSTNTWGKQLQFRDTTGKRIARIQPMAVTTTNNRVGMWVNNAGNTVEKGIYVDSDGTTSAPTPAVGDNSTKIATTAYINTKFRVMNEADLPADRDANTFYFVKE